MGKSRTIFISYSRHDQAIVAPFSQMIRAGGADVLRDVELLEPGDIWSVKLVEALKAADRVFVFWSVHAAKSQPVADEFNSAIADGKSVVPVLLDYTPLPECLKPYQWIDCRNSVVVAESVSGGSTAGGAGIGAVVGTSIMPGVGTLVGWLLGAFFGGRLKHETSSIQRGRETELLRQLAPSVFFD